MLLPHNYPPFHALPSLTYTPGPSIPDLPHPQYAGKTWTALQFPGLHPRNGPFLWTNIYFPGTQSRSTNTTFLYSNEYQCIINKACSWTLPQEAEHEQYRSITHWLAIKYKEMMFALRMHLIPLPTCAQGRCLFHIKGTLSYMPSFTRYLIACLTFGASWTSSKMMTDFRSFNSTPYSNCRRMKIRLRSEMSLNKSRISVISKS